MWNVNFFLFLFPFFFVFCFFVFSNTEQSNEHWSFGTLFCVIVSVSFCSESQRSEFSHTDEFLWNPYCLKSLARHLMSFVFGVANFVKFLSIVSLGRFFFQIIKFFLGVLFQHELQRWRHLCWRLALFLVCVPLKIVFFFLNLSWGSIYDNSTHTLQMKWRPWQRWTSTGLTTVSETESLQCWLFYSLAWIGGESSTIHSPPALFFFFKWRSACAN